MNRVTCSNCGRETLDSLTTTHGDYRLCFQCQQAALDRIDACDHIWSRDTDQDGSDGVHCHKCNAFVASADSEDMLGFEVRPIAELN